MKIEDRISKARTELLLDHPWFGALSMNLRIIPEPSIPTFDVDGTTMRYNPEFADKLTAKELVGVIAHEVMHCALLHIFRRGTRDPFLWNVAADFAINQEIINSGLTLPAGCLLDAKFSGLAAEVIYSQLKQQIQQLPKNAGQQGTGTFSDAPSNGQSGNDKKDKDGKASGASQDSHNNEDFWKVAAEQAAKVAKAAGKLSGNLERLIGECRASKTDWKSELKEFIEQTVPSDYSWQTPNRRYIHQNVYLPGTVKEGFGRLVIAVDTSGSIHQAALNAFASEVSAICSEIKPEQVTVIYCDAQVQKIQEIEPDGDVQLKPYGGGGTRFNPVFEEIAKWEEPPKVLLYFTDLECYDKPQEPEYPTLWVTDLAVTAQPPFGKAIRIEA